MNTKHLENKMKFALDQARVGEPGDCVEAALKVFAMAKAEQERFENVAAQAKALIIDVMAETHCTDYTTDTGRASITSDAEVVRYNTKALDALMASDDGLARLLEPHRSITMRPGTLRINLTK